VLGINARSSPAAFPSSSFIPFPPFLSSSAPLVSASFTNRFNLPEALWPPTNSYNRANKKNGSTRLPACIRFVPRNTLLFQIASVFIHSPLNSIFLTSGLALTVTLMACLVKNVPVNYAIRFSGPVISWYGV
jgi:hypothetical protein